VVGFGKQKRKNIISGVAMVNTEQLGCARGSNRVVLIKTKSAKVRQSEFSYNGYVDIRYVPHSWRPKMLNATQYARYNKERREALSKFNNEPPKPTSKVFQEVLDHPENEGKVRHVKKWE
jgi:hypothetical protein